MNSFQSFPANKNTFSEKKNNVHSGKNPPRSFAYFAILIPKVLTKKKYKHALKTVLLFQ